MFRGSTALGWTSSDTLAFRCIESVAGCAHRWSASAVATRRHQAGRRRGSGLPRKPIASNDAPGPGSGVSGLRRVRSRRCAPRGSRIWRRCLRATWSWRHLTATARPRTRRTAPCRVLPCRLATWATQSPVGAAAHESGYSPLLTIALKPPTEKDGLSDQFGAETMPGLGGSFRWTAVASSSGTRARGGPSAARTFRCDFPCTTPTPSRQTHVLRHRVVCGEGPHSERPTASAAARVLEAGLTFRHCSGPCHSTLRRTAGPRRSAHRQARANLISSCRRRVDDRSRCRHSVMRHCGGAVVHHVDRH